MARSSSNAQDLRCWRPTPAESPAAIARTSAVRLRVQLPQAPVTPANTVIPAAPPTPTVLTVLAAPANRFSASEAPTSTPTPKVRDLETRLLTAMKRRDSAQALNLASVLVYECPGHEVAQAVKQRCFQSVSNPTVTFPEPGAVARMRVEWQTLRSRTLSRREAFMLSCIDGRLSVEDLVDMSAMSPLVAYTTLDSLVRQGLVELS